MSLDLLQMNVTGSVVATSRRWRRMCHATLTRFHVSEACAGPLLMIARLGDGVRQVTVAQHCGLESPSLVRLLDQLCDAGLVCRSEDPTDRRAKTLNLTDEGRHVAQSIEVELVRFRREVFHNVTESDLQATLRVLDALAAPASQDDEEPPV